MHALTLEPKTMMVDLWYNNEYAYAVYSGFTIWIAKQNILLIIKLLSEALLVIHFILTKA